MSYVPINVNMYLAAFDGVLAGMAASDRIPKSTSPVDYLSVVSVAGAWAAAFDTSWNSVTANSSELAQAQNLSDATWQMRAPVIATSTNRAASYYAAQTDALVAIILAADSYLAGQGIVPPSPGGTLAGDVTGPLGANIVEKLSGSGGFTSLLSILLSDANAEIQAPAGDVVLSGGVNALLLAASGNANVAGNLQAGLSAGTDVIVTGQNNAQLIATTGNAIVSALAGNVQIQSGAPGSTDLIGAVNVAVVANDGNAFITATGGSVVLNSDSPFEFTNPASTKQFITDWQSQQTVGAAGAAAALPLTPSGYIQVQIVNADFPAGLFAVIPYYAAI